MEKLARTQSIVSPIMSKIGFGSPEDEDYAHDEL